MDVKIQKLITGRHQANQEILKSIEKMVDKYPDLRFGQILVNLGIIEYEQNTYDELPITKDPFYEESIITLKRIKKNK